MSKEVSGQVSGQVRGDICGEVSGEECELASRDMSVDIFGHMLIMIQKIHRYYKLTEISTFV